MNKKTLIFDIDGTLTNLWPIERVVLAEMLGVPQPEKLDRQKTFKRNTNYEIFLRCSRVRCSKQEFTQRYTSVFLQLKAAKRLPVPKLFLIVAWLKDAADSFHCVYATGGQRAETQYVLEELGISSLFDLTASVDKTTCRYSKSTGIPLRKIAARYPNCLLITDSESDCRGAHIANIPFLRIQPGQIDLSVLSVLYTS